MPAVSGDAARARSAPFVEEPSFLSYADAETCTLNLPPQLLKDPGSFFSICVFHVFHENSCVFSL